MGSYIGDILEDRLKTPQEDMLTMIANAEIDGKPVEWSLKVGYVRLLIIAGIDTTWSAIGSGLWHFANNPQEVVRLVAVSDDDSLWQTASEEVLRYYAPVTMARKVIADTEVAGCPVHAGDQMLLTFPAANHDPASFDHPEQFQLDRAENRHVAFGLGIHRCVGSNLARLELLVGLQEWLRAFPNYRLQAGRETTWANGQIRGPRNIPVELNR
jgi:cytochrome P450